MRKMKESEIKLEITKSKKFYNAFLKANDNIKELFIQLALESSIYSCNDNGYVKEMTETGYRLAKPYYKGRKIQNYCMYTISADQKIIIDIRTDGIGINSTILNLINRGDCFNGGFEWYRFAIKDKDELLESLRLIAICYVN